MKAVLTFGPQLEPIFLDEDSRIMEMMSSDFFKNNGRPVPQTVQKLGAGFGNLSGQAFSETQNSLGPQGEVLRFNDNHDEKTGQFTSGDGSAKEEENAPSPERINEMEKGEEPIETYLNWTAKDQGEAAAALAAFQAYENGSSSSGIKSEGTQKVKIEDLNATQDRINTGTLNDKLHGKDLHFPIVVKSASGKLFIVDGHHSAIAKLLQGRKEIYVKLYSMAAADNSARSLAQRFNDEHDAKTGEFTSGGGSSKESQWKSSGTNVSGDVKTTTYSGKNQTIVVEHNTKENKITVKHLDSNGDLLVQQMHDSVGAARKELTTQGIDHKFYALRSEQRADDEGGEWITIHGAHVFIKDGVIEKGPEGFVGKTPQEIGSSSSNGTAGPPPLATWTSGAWSACSRMRNEAKKDIEEGRADSNALVVACRKDDLTGEAHRGIAVPETSGVLKYKVGDEIQLMPQSFSYDKGIAQNFAKSEKDIHNDKFLLHPDKAGPRWESVMFHVSASGAKGWNIGSNTKYKVHDEAEVAMQGRYRVTGVKHGKKGYDFALEQIGTF